MYAKHNILVILTCLLTLTAGLHSESLSTRHFLFLTGAGGYGSTLSKPFETYNLEDKAGGVGSFGIGYEIEHKWFFFNLGISGDYSRYGHTLEAFTDTRDAVDLDNDPHIYEYLYSNFAEKQDIVHASVPINFGFMLNPIVYLSIGAKISWAMISKYDNSVDMFTQGIYEKYPEPLNSSLTDQAIRWGFYPLTTYGEKSNSKTAINTAQMRAAATIEIGARIPIKSKKIFLRTGLYAEYGLPIIDSSNFELLHLTDYSHVNFDPQTQTQANLYNNLKFNSILDSDFNQRAYHNITAGVKLTLGFDVTIKKQICRCERW